MNKQPRKILRELTLVSGIIFLIISILVLFFGVVMFLQVGSEYYVLLSLFLGLICLGLGIGLLMSYSVTSALENRMGTKKRRQNE